MDGLLAGPDSGGGAVAWTAAETPLPDFEAALRGRAVHLVPVLVEHHEMLRALELSPELALRGRLGGRTPGPEEFAAGLPQGALAQFIVVEISSSQPAGLVSAYNANHANGTVFLGCWKFPTGTRPTAFVQGSLLFLHYLFMRWPFRKAYAETPEYNLLQFASGLNRLFVEEGRLKQFHYMDGRYWDRVYLSIDRQTLQDRLQQFGPYVLSRDVPSRSDTAV